MRMDRAYLACERALYIARSPADIWTFMLDLSNDKRWRTGVLDARVTSVPPVRLGTTGVHRAVCMGDFSWIITEWDDGRRAGWDFTSGALAGTHGSYRIEPERAGSRVIISATMRLNGMWSALMPLMRPIVPRLLAGDLRKLKALMEAPVGAP